MAELDSHRAGVASHREGVVVVGLDSQGATTLTATELAPVRPDEVVLAAPVLEAAERLAHEPTRRAEAFAGAGHRLARTVLLHGAPGTGKSLLVRHLCTSGPTRTTVIAGGLEAHLLGQAMEVALRLAPSILVIEDVDEAARDRQIPDRPLASSLVALTSLLDGLRADADVCTLLTTSRVDLLDPALSVRPGRVDLVVELPLPDRAGRARLLEAALGGPPPPELVEVTAGASGAFCAELGRRAHLLAVTRGSGGPLDHLDDALAELRELATPALRRSLGIREGVIR
jgi:ATP-dependent 26S proteasome regulatory subunit